MKTWVPVCVVLLAVLFVFGQSEARSKRVGQIPNGAVFSCANCHTSPGGPRNAFGKDVEQNYLDANGDVIWNAALAALDSDGDGATNGQELQDPGGQWRVGQADPGDKNLVTNPGDPNSVPATAVFERGRARGPGKFQLKRAYPNPFNPETNIAFEVPVQTWLRVVVLDIQGREVRTLASGTYEPGRYRVVWDGRDEAGRQLGSGIYLCTLESSTFRATRRLVLLR